MTTPPTATSSTTQIEFHRRNSPVTIVSTYGFSEKGDAVLIRTPDEGPKRYAYVSYCQKHEAAWDPRDFGVCPLCDPDLTTQKRVS